MKNFTKGLIAAFTFVLLLSCKEHNERYLYLIVKDQQLRPITVRNFDPDPKFIFGRALFYDPILSGDRDVSCATCHVLSHGLSDGLAVSIPVGSHALSSRFQIDIGSTGDHSRNTLELWNRDNNSAKALFWDGRVEMIDPIKRIFRTPLNRHLPAGLENTLSVQALFPLITPKEMLGDLGDSTLKNLETPYEEIGNDLVRDLEGLDYPARANTIFSRIVTRVLGSLSIPSFTWQQEYRLLYEAAYPESNWQHANIVDFANAISHYEELAFATTTSIWDEYLKGRPEALSTDQKRGAILFFGKGRCHVCHSGVLFSDFEYYALGIPEVGLDGNSIKDLGRFYASGDELDMYKFRTPPLRNVTKSGPYFHNGSAKTLGEVIEQHIDPYRFADGYNVDGSFKMNRKQIGSISPILGFINDISEEEKNLIIDFLYSLESNVSNERREYMFPPRILSNLNDSVL